jgi:hypothetical protein
MARKSTPIESGNIWEPEFHDELTATNSNATVIAQLYQ